MIVLLLSVATFICREACNLWSNVI